MEETQERTPQHQTMTTTTSPPSPASKLQPSIPQASNRPTRKSSDRSARVGARESNRRQQRQFLHSHQLSQCRASGVHAARFSSSATSSLAISAQAATRLASTCSHGNSRAPAPDLAVSNADLTQGWSNAVAELSIHADLFAMVAAVCITVKLRCTLKVPPQSTSIQLLEGFAAQLLRRSPYAAPALRDEDVIQQSSTKSSTCCSACGTKCPSSRPWGWKFETCGVPCSNSFDLDKIQHSWRAKVPILSHFRRPSPHGSLVRVSCLQLAQQRGRATMRKHCSTPCSVPICTFASSCATISNIMHGCSHSLDFLMFPSASCLHKSHSSPLVIVHILIMSCAKQKYMLVGSTACCRRQREGVRNQFGVRDMNNEENRKERNENHENKKLKEMKNMENHMMENGGTRECSMNSTIVEPLSA